MQTGVFFRAAFTQYRLAPSHADYPAQAPWIQDALRFWEAANFSVQGVYSAFLVLP